MYVLRFSKKKNELLQFGESTVYDLISGHALEKT